MRRPLTPILLALAAAATGLTVATATAPTASAEETIACSTTTGSSDFYPGDSASARYDDLFGPGDAVPSALLDSYNPQGMGTWPNWGGPGQDLLLLTGYNATTHQTVLVGQVPGGGYTRLVPLPYSHAGGVAVAKGHLYVSGEGDVLNRYSLRQLRARFADGGALAPKQTFHLGIPRVSFLAVSGRELFAGTFESGGRGTMNTYRVADDGGLSSLRQGTQVPKKTQGMVATKSHFIYSTSSGSDQRGNIYVVRRGHKLLDAAYPQDLTCFRAPSLAEGMTRSNGVLHLAFESGSFKYRDDACDRPQPIERDCTRNIITDLHRASLASLTSLT